MTIDAQRDDFLATEQRLYESVGLTPRSRNVKLALRGSSAPVSIRVAEIATSARQDAQPLVWVHGGGGFGGQWAKLVAAVEKRAPGRFRHIIVDRPGCGASDPFFYWEEPDLRTHAVTVLNGVLDALGVDRAGFVANSMGALWSLWLGSAHPGRVEGLVACGVPALLLDTSAPFPMRLCATPWIGRRLMRMDPGTREQAAAVWRRLGHPDAARIGNETLDLTAAVARLPHWGESFASLINRVLRLRGPRISFTETEWRRLAVPVHLVWGDRDPFGSVRSARRAVELRPQTKLDIVEGAGHAPWFDDVGVCAAAVIASFEGARASARKNGSATAVSALFDGARAGASKCTSAIESVEPVRSS